MRSDFSLDDSKWLLITTGALLILIGLLKIAIPTPGVLFFLVGGALLILGAQISIVGVRLALLILWTLGITADFFVRQNPLSIIFILMGVWLTIKILRLPPDESSPRPQRKL